MACYDMGICMVSTAKSPRRERERQRHRQEILSAGLRLFAEKGFHNVSMHEIAAAAEFATGTLYNFFPSKEDLFFELLESCAEGALALILPALEGPGDECQRLARFIRMQERIPVEQGVAIRLYLLESRGRCLPGPRVEAKKKEIDERVVSRLSEVIAAGVRKGLFNDIDPVIAAKCLSVTLESMILTAAAEPQAVNLKGDLRKVEAVFFKGIVKSWGDKRDA
jgi:TetR/AcrR family transcriptional regulator